jgi:hypothetical protein
MNLILYYIINYLILNQIPMRTQRLAFIAISNPLGLIVGGVALAAWEIYEYKRDQAPAPVE